MATLTLAWTSSFTAMLVLLRLFCLAAAADLFEKAWGWDNGSQPISIFRSVSIYSSGLMPKQALRLSCTD